MKNNLTIYIADDHNVVRNAMTRLLKTFNRIGEVKDAANGKELIKLIKEKTPDAVVLDIEMPVRGGIDTAHSILTHFPDVKILMLTMHTEEAFIKRLIDMGVNGFLGKTTEPEEMERAIYSIVDNDFYKGDLLNSSAITKKVSDPTLEKLSNRELEILMLICQEYTPGEISTRLNISEKTFNNHRASIIAKTGAKNNIGLYKYAVQHGYL
jgi:two-component system, NarL family, response regulator DegU